MNKDFENVPDEAAFGNEEVDKEISSKVKNWSLEELEL